jgi:hypothetical protein
LVGTATKDLHSKEVADLEYFLKDVVSENSDGNADGNAARKRPD